MGGVPPSTFTRTSVLSPRPLSVALDSSTQF